MRHENKDEDSQLNRTTSLQSIYVRRRKLEVGLARLRLGATEVGAVQLLLQGSVSFRSLCVRHSNVKEQSNSFL